MAQNPFEQQWAMTLKKTQQKTKRQQQVPLATQQEQLTEHLAYYKGQLHDAIMRKTHDEIEFATEKLIELRAEQTALALEDWRQRYGIVSADMMKTYSERYTKDCLKLIDAVAGNLA